MFGRENPQSGEPETIIGPSVRVEGNFTGGGDVVVEGALSGTLKTSKSVRIGTSAKVKADIEASSVMVAGEVRGNVKSSGAVELASTARVIGNIEAGQLRVEAGAILSGKCTMPTASLDPVANGERRAKREPAAL
jgi:cytoskeletal protein CcmA (bactofilin family)